MTAYGVDGGISHEQLGPKYLQWDFEKFLLLDNADYIVSTECGEHISRDHEGEFLRTLTQAKKSLILAWARPGQKGHGHVNERSKAYLIAKIHAMSRLRYCPQVSYYLVKDAKVNMNWIWLYGYPMVFFSDNETHPYRCSWIFNKSPLLSSAVYIAGGIILCGFGLCVHQVLQFWAMMKKRRYIVLMALVLVVYTLISLASELHGFDVS